MQAILAWLSANIGTIIICAILIAFVSLLIYSMIRDKKKGKSSCGCGGCSGCAFSGSCHNTAEKKKK